MRLFQQVLPAVAALNAGLGRAPVYHDYLPELSVLHTRLVAAEQHSSAVYHFCHLMKATPATILRLSEDPQQEVSTLHRAFPGSLVTETNSEDGLPVGSFDLIDLSTASPPPRAVLQQCGRALPPGGVLALRLTDAPSSKLDGDLERAGFAVARSCSRLTGGWTVLAWRARPLGGGDAVGYSPPSFTTASYTSDAAPPPPTTGTPALSMEDAMARVAAVTITVTLLKAIINASLEHFA
jgi:SAM-dependent methyltransferase